MAPREGLSESRQNGLLHWSQETPESRVDTSSCDRKLPEIAGYVRRENHSRADGGQSERSATGRRQRPVASAQVTLQRLAAAADPSTQDLLEEMKPESDVLYLNPQAPAYLLRSWERTRTGLGGLRVARELAEVLQALDLFPVSLQDRRLDVSGKFFGVGPVNI